MTKKGCILSAPLVFYNFDTQHAEFMNYIQMATAISVNMWHMQSVWPLDGG